MSGGLGPLGRLRLFGFICPCHESDDEFVARVCVENLRCVPVQWFRSADVDVILEAIIAVIDRPLGPTFQLLCGDARRGNFSDLPTVVSTTSTYFTEHGNKLYVEVPLYQIDRVELCDDGDSSKSELQLYVYDDEERKPTLLLQFRPNSTPLLDTVEDLTGVLQWDRVRRADLEAAVEHNAAMQRMRDERKRLIDEEREPTS